MSDIIMITIVYVLVILTTHYISARYVAKKASDTAIHQPNNKIYDMLRKAQIIHIICFLIYSAIVLSKIVSHLNQ